MAECQAEPRELKWESREENHLMEEKKKKKQEEKKKKEAAQKKAGEQKTKVPDSAKPSPLSPSNPSHEHKQLLKRGQPLPGSGQTRALSPPRTPSAAASQTCPGTPHTEPPHPSVLGPQYENPPWGPPPPTNRSGWDQVIIDESDAEAWPSISRGDGRSAAERQSADSEVVTETRGSAMSMASGPGHFPAHHKPGAMATSQGGASRGWGSGPAHCPPSEGKGTPAPGGRGQPCWGSPTLNLNLNPNANPSAWPVLGHEGRGRGGGSGTSNPPPASAARSRGPATAPTETSRGPVPGGHSTPTTAPSHAPSPATNVSFSGEPLNLNTDGPNPAKQEPPSPATPSRAGGLAPSWGLAAGGGLGQAFRPGQRLGGGRQPPREQPNSWTRPGDAPSDAPPSEGSSDSQEGGRGRRERLSRRRLHPPPPRPVPVPPGPGPRVLCNTGWGQTPVRQHTSWETKEAARAAQKSDKGTEAWGPSSSSSSSSSSCSSSSSSSAAAPLASPPPGSAPRSDSGEGRRGGASSGWGRGSDTRPAQLRMGDPPPGKKAPNGGGAGGGGGGRGWGGPQNGGGPKSGPCWTPKRSPLAGTMPKPSPKRRAGGRAQAPHGWGNGGGGEPRSGDWGEPGEGKKSGPPPWDGEGGGWKENPRGWSKPGTGGLGQQAPGQPQRRGGTVGSWGDPGVGKQCGSGWGRRGGAKRDPPGGEPTGWEEPSPPSIRRKMEIDDGTSAWGDPNTHHKTVNLWDRNSHVTQGSPAPGNSAGSRARCPGQRQQHQRRGLCQHAPLTRTSLEPRRADPPWPTRVGASYPACTPRRSPRGRAGPHPGCGQRDLGLGQTPGQPRGWGNGGPESAGPYGRASAPSGPPPASQPPNLCKTAGEAAGRSRARRGAWEPDDGDVWNSPASQESSSSCSSWGNPPKKGPQKGKVASKQDEAWIMNRLIKQLTDMGFPRDPAEEALKSNNMNLDQAMSALLEKKTELDKRGMGLSEYSSGLGSKPMSCRLPPLAKESCSDRAPFGDKVQGGMFVSSGAAQTRAMQQQAPPPQPSVPLGSAQPSLRAQVPQFLSPQVQAQLLQFAAKNIGLNPALLTSPISPQHMTLLNQLYQLQLAYQRLQIQQQVLQGQRNVSGPIRQQEQQVARTINNMQQQIQQHQRQLAQTLLLKQQPPSHPGLHPNAGKSALDSFPPHPQASGLSDLQTKEPQSSPNSYSPYPLSGLNPNMNVNSMEVGGLSMKEPPQPQSRLSQWTHPNAMETLSGSSSPLEPNLNKHGALGTGANLGPPGKPPLDDSYSPYSLMSGSEAPPSPLVTPDSWGQGKNANDKIANGTNINWPPEFCPGVPWKGLQNIDPETDPNMTPGSVPSGPTINTNIQDVNRYLLRDRSGAKLSDMKSSWSPGPPPPGGGTLGLVPGWSSSYSAGTTWSTDSSNRTSSWLVLRNLTPQIDGSTLRTLCMQHGPLITFHLNLTQGNAVVRYSSKEEAAKAQKSLHMCVLGNTTILAEFAGEEEVNRFFAQGQSLATTPTSSWQPNQGTNQTRLGGAGAGPSHAMGHWNSSGVWPRPAETCCGAESSSTPAYGDRPAGRMGGSMEALHQSTRCFLGTC
ncbi:hypothetical protein ANANG_G00297110 [Anguilla anguilla]|uniref:Trinucleotide repeat-containing gene 6C protein n=1 Tax=Anguilla anguilla TaxID=7936 RepID=A0A9D3LP03_ANGAN|nr:hypothetical protein ANANG_G00297110 [Anguilla anguilla]